MKMIRLATFIAIATLSLPGLAVATENEPNSVADGASSTAPMAPTSTDAVKRPAILPVLYVTFAAMQAWDVYSTTAALKAGASERNPIAVPFAGDPASLITLKIMSTAGTIYFTERLWKTNRVKAVLVLAAINGATAAISMHNMRNVRAAAGR